MGFSKLKYKIKLFIRFVVFALLNRIVICSSKLKQDRVLFLSDVRDVLDGNLGYVYNYLDDKEYEKIILFKKDRKEKRSFKNKLKLIYFLSTSKYIVLDDFSRFISLMHVRKGQQVCQLWHGAGAFKKFGHSRTDQGNGKIKKILGHRNYTKAIVSSPDIRWCYAEGFGMNIDNIKATGFPRTDMFFDEKYKNERKNELYKEYSFLKDKKVILFAPTYRGNSLKRSYYDYEKLNVEKIYNEFKDKGYIFIFKWHPGLYYQMNKKEIKPYELEKYSNFYYDLSEVRDINDLLLITDILITDYSSVIFDYVLLNKPVIYFVYDYEEYNKERGLYFDFKDYIYGEVAKNTDELIEAIKKDELNEKKRKKFIEKFMIECDGRATEKTCKWIFEI